MLFHASIVAFSFLFFVLLEAVVAIPFQYVVLAFLAMAILFRVSWRFGGSAALAIVPTLFSLSTVILLFFISTPKEKHIFIFLSTAVFYVSVLGIYRLRHSVRDLTAQSMLSLVAMTTLFFLFSAFSGIFLNFARFNELALMISYGVSTFLVGLSLFSRSYPADIRTATLYAFILGLFSAELAWFSSFWPFGYLTSGVLTLMFISPIWDMIHNDALGVFSKKRLAAHLILMLMLIGMVLMSSNWLQVV